MRRRIGLTVTLTLALSVVLAAPALACETGMWITSDIDSGEAGTVVTVRGGGWEPGSVTLRWDASAESGGAVLGEAPVTADGTIEAQVTIPEGSPGQHKIVAEHTESTGEATHSGDWTYFDIPGAAAPQEQPTVEEKEETQKADRRERPAEKVAEVPDATPRPVGRPGVIDVPSETQAVPSETQAVPTVEGSEKTAFVAEQRPASETRIARFPLEDRARAETGPTLGEAAVSVDPPSVESPLQTHADLNDESLPWLFAGAVGALLLALMARRSPIHRPTRAHVLSLPIPDDTKGKERDAA